MRLRETELCLKELTTLVKKLSSRVSQADRTREEKTVGHDSAATSNAPESDDGESPLEQMSKPADHVVSSAPIVVLREMGRRCTGTDTRARATGNVDILELGLLSQAEADALIEVFLYYKKHNVVIGELGETTTADELRKTSPFMHSVCCLHAIAYQSDMVGGIMHKKIFDQVRTSLGRVLLLSPLTLEDIQGVLLMTDNGPFKTNSHPDFIDSWMLTGYCIKQAMLSISFSEIVTRIKTGASTAEDQRAIRLWATICLQHLHWAASTGRPSTIPAAYLDSCNILLSFYDASMHDGMLLSEVLLYTNLLEKLETRHAPQSSPENLGFPAWKERWNHLLSLPTASMLKVGYYSASLVLAVRFLQELDEDLSSNTFMNDRDRPSSGSPISSRQQSTRDEETANLRAGACSNARVILQTFLQMPADVKNSVGSNRCLCLVYSAMVLAHYGEPESRVQDRISLDLIKRLNQWLNSDLSKAWVGPALVVTGEGSGSGPSPLSTATPANGAFPGPQEQDFEWGTFPNMEDFFSGGFLDFGFMDRTWETGGPTTMRRPG
ncbi:hypothetical protein F5X68DRAFT_247418 [Plectosphaerella plurivora]|uniref:Uncharacterized protein n=1 Tax=Plectosphaerella plurivora TaxID=936078 RepID=A0A9P8V3R5_9PEZI|nr:hypothetical protein F5X68DRAFT_247418 [Plectosphaerella plurivora]